MWVWCFYKILLPREELYCKVLEYLIRSVWLSACHAKRCDCVCVLQCLQMDSLISFSVQLLHLSCLSAMEICVYCSTDICLSWCWSVPKEHILLSVVCSEFAIVCLIDIVYSLHIVSKTCILAQLSHILNKVKSVWSKNSFMTKCS